MPTRPASALQTYISLLRRALAPAGDVSITRQGAGYKLTADAQSIDMHRFRSAWALPTLPAAALIPFCFGALACAVARYLRSWQETEYLNLAQTLLFLVPGTDLATPLARTCSSR